jgi:hypothetical protein
METAPVSETFFSLEHQPIDEVKKLSDNEAACVCTAVQTNSTIEQPLQPIGSQWHLVQLMFTTAATRTRSPHSDHTAQLCVPYASQSISLDGTDRLVFVMQIFVFSVRWELSL